MLMYLLYTHTTHTYHVYTNPIRIEYHNQPHIPYISTYFIEIGRYENLLRLRKGFNER